MKRRTLLAAVTGAIAVVGLGLATVPFLGSLRPSANAGSSLPRLPVSRLEPGTSQLFKLSGDFGYFVLRDLDGTWRPFAVMTSREGHLVMPDMHWWRFGGTCRSFGPDTKDGKMVAGGVLSCHDPDVNEWAKAEWRWTYSGKNLGKHTDDMFEVPYTLEGKDLVPLKRA